MTAASDRLAHSADRLTGTDALRSLSINHRTAPIDELERMALSPAAVADLHQSFRAHGLEAAVLSTCNRTELYSYAARPGDHARAEALLMAAAGDAAPTRGHFAEAAGLAAATHLFRVAAGLESLVVGEAEVLGQVRTAIEAAEAAGTAGFFLSGLFRAALRFGGRARSETGIGTGALSVASASIQLLARVHPDLSACTVLVVGAGTTGLKAARHLKAERVGRLVLANRTPRRAEEEAAELGAEAVALEDVPRLLVGFDAVVVAAQVERPLITAVMLGEARAGASEPLVLIDVSLPRAIDPACAKLAGVVLHDLSGLEQIVAHNRAGREGEIPRVVALLEQELRMFAAQARESTVRPLVAELRHRAEAIRREEIERALGDGLRDGALLERVTRRIVDRLLRAPSAALRRGDLALDEQHARYLRMVFGLGGEAPGDHH
ncbi:MAG: glutamyl-tRNA reductase [Candidatus Eisenbacteria bacterium]